MTVMQPQEAGRLVADIDPELEAVFSAAAENAGEQASKLLDIFMRAYVERHGSDATAEARRACQFFTARAADPTSDEAEVLSWIGQLADTEGWKA